MKNIWSASFLFCPGFRWHPRLSSKNAADYVEVQVFQNSGGFLAIKHINATSPEFGMAKVP